MQTPADRPPPPMGTSTVSGRPDDPADLRSAPVPQLLELLDDLEADGALAGHDARVVEGGHEGQAIALGELVRTGDALLVVGAHELDLGAVRAHARRPSPRAHPRA